MADENHCHIASLLQLFNQLQNLRLNCHIQSSGGLIANQKPRLIDQRHRNHNPLTHTARKLMGVTIKAGRCIHNADFIQQFNSSLAGLLPTQAASLIRMVDQRFNQLLTNTDKRI